MAQNSIKYLTITIIIFIAHSILAFETTMDMVIKTDKQIKKIKIEMNEKINMFKKSLDKTAQGLFDNEQKKWLQYMNAKTNFAADKYRGGSLSRLIGLMSMAKEFKVRLKQIESYIENHNKP